MGAAQKILAEKCLLVVDDEQDLRDIIVSELELQGALVYQASNGLEAFDLLNQHKVHLVISDIRMPDGDGLSLLKNIQKKAGYRPPLVFITGFADVPASEAMALGAKAVLAKPFKMSELLKIVCNQCLAPRPSNP